MTHLPFELLQTIVSNSDEQWFFNTEFEIVVRFLIFRSFETHFFNVKKSTRYNDKVAGQ